jgi:signal transduction histidine kinase
VTDLKLDAERLARLADDLLALSREDTGTHPDELVRLDELVLVAGENVVVSALPVEVEGDRAALERAVGNLLENAHRHGPAQGAVTLTVTQEGERARVTVTDQGAGLTADETERAFERFWRRGSESGSGLGLAIVRATAERHGGRAYARGSSFTIELPVFRKASETRSTPVEEDLEKGSP